MILTLFEIDKRICRMGILLVTSFRNIASVAVMDGTFLFKSVQTFLAFQHSLLSPSVVHVTFFWRVSARPQLGPVASNKTDFESVRSWFLAPEFLDAVMPKIDERLFSAFLINFCRPVLSSSDIPVSDIIITTRKDK